MKQWKKLSSKTVYKNPWIKVHEDSVIRPDGKEGIYGVIDKTPGCRIIALNAKNEIVLIINERYPVGKELIEIPAGENTKGKTGLESAQIELQQETGLTAKSWENIGKVYWVGGLVNAYDHIYVASDLEGDTTLSNQEGDDAIAKLFWKSIPDVKEMIKNNEIECGITLASLQLFFTKYNM